ncbi:hypothetical protein C8Q74DRAFT_574438 [Fomes fomentarius]|nr:hypothetical protein C8Q74DRAFT_574438 [Fomes fomentarius]
MVAYSTRFSLLAVLTSIAAMRVSALPAPLQSSALSIRQSDQPPQVALAARHSDKDERVTRLAAADDGDDDHSGSDTDGNGSDSSDDAPSSSSTHERHHAKTSTNTANQTSRTPRTARTTQSATATPTEHARHTKPVVPLPASMSKSGKKKAQPASDGEDSNTISDDDGGDDKNQSDSSKKKQTRETWAIDPMTRMRSLWMGARGMSARQVVTNGRLRAGKRHHHHHHHDDHDDHDEVVVKGDHDHVNVHDRSVESDADGIGARSPHNDHGRVIVKGHNDHVHVHDDHDDDPVIVKGDDNHIHVRRSPSPHPHHHHHHDKVIVKGNNDSVHVHRRTPAPRRHHHHKIVGQGNHDRAHFRRSPEPHHHHHHHDDAKVVVEGDHDQVSVHRRQARMRNTSPIFISGNGGNTYVMHPASTASSGGGLLDMMAGIGMNVKRDGQKEGVPGIIEILSQNANDQQGQKLASLVLASNSNDGDPDGSPFVLNASNSDRTVMYLVPVSPVNDTSVSATAASATTSSTRSYLPVILKTPVFVANSAQMEDYCATFDPRPVAPAPMTVEKCMEGSSSDDHKSQVYAYDPQTGFVRPMWYEGEDDGTHDDSPSGTAVTGQSTQSGGATSAATSSIMATSAATTTATSEATSSTAAEPSGVTSLAQEELDDQYGSATQPATPAGLAKMLNADTLDLERAQNVTLIFTPSAPEVKLRLKADPVTTSGSADIPTTTDSSVSTITASSTSDLTDSSSTTDVMNMAPTATSTTSMTSSATDTDNVLPTSSPIPDSTPVTSDQPLLTDSSTLATFTSSPALEVKVYNPYANNLADTTSSTVTVTFVSSSVDSATSTLVSDSNGSTMTPVSTAPYEWLFKQRSLE